MILIILATSVLVLVPYEISIASPAKVAIAAVTPLISKINNKVAVDKFAIREIYPTKPNGGREWYINMNSPLNDDSFSLSGGTEKTNSSLANATSSNGQIVKQPDSSYQVYGVRKAGKYNFSVRMNVNTLDHAQWWKNVEITGYTKVISVTSNDARFRLVCKGWST